ncbi:hypothetical protein BCR34DRAFT_566933 [Clohesyomyces aquaticus]|uniref:Uncharacterized protein n=1 Tax=Clohesyomyces aquaticus TaxID=1231657 RepID=A0A1Y1ZJJ9_9PLEO|nr:hypothetical protein BCR34DRAFT_566933 [Clohesyomyces aquaticus]
MGLLSILPASFSTVETWVTRIFLLLGIITIGPWAALLLYDLLLYIFRSISHEIPVIGGRARGKARPRAPSLTERPSGHRRRFSLARPLAPGVVKSDAAERRWRHIKEESEEDSSST